MLHRELANLRVQIMDLHLVIRAGLVGAIGKYRA